MLTELPGRSGRPTSPLSFSPMNCSSIGTVDCPEPVPLNAMLSNHNIPKSILVNRYEIELPESNASVHRGSSPHEQIPPQISNPRICLSDLPVEIQESILDHLFGARASTTSHTPG